MLAVREEHRIVGGLEMTRKTLLADTDQGVFMAETRDFYLPGVPATTVQPSAPHPLPLPPPVPYTPPSEECDWMECCFGCEGGHEWYSPAGKGFCIVLLLLVLYLIVGEILLAYFLLFCLLTNCDDN